MTRAIFAFRTTVVLVAVIISGCQGEVELGVTAGVDACHSCNMVIDRVNQACGYIDDGKLIVFDAPVCLLGSYEELRENGAAVPGEVFFADYNDGTWHPADSTVLLLTEHIPTVMNAGVICFSSSGAAEAMRKHPDEKVLDWIGYRTMRGTPNTIFEVVVNQAAMVPDIVELAKGDLAVLKIRGSGLEDDMTISVTGYPETGSVTVPAMGEEVSLRILALRPGSGFPVIDAQSGSTLGRIRVSGAHTLDEEEM